MTMNSKYAYAFAGLLLGLTACSNEDLRPTSGLQKGETVFVSLKVDRNKAETRTIIEETDVTNGVGLSNVWAPGDQVTLVAADGAVAGTLTLQSEGGSSEGIFSGEVTIAGGKYTVWYLGDARDGNPYAEFNEQGELVKALATPDCPVSGEFGDLNKGDLMNSEVEIIVKDGKATVAESVTLASQMAMAHFTLSMDGLDTALNADGAKLTLSYTVGETPYSYSITNKSADVFVPLFPGEYAPSFTLVSGEKTYTYAFKSATQVNAGVYYCGAKNATTGKSDGISVTLKDPTVTDPYEGYENEDPRNPLHKFAKYNLVRVGEIGSLENGFASAETENGALYQWGRNYGYMDDKGIYTNPRQLYIPNTDFINYAEAQGFMTYDLDNGISKADFYAYREPGSYTEYNLSTGVSMHYTNSAGVFFNSPYEYTSVAEIKAHPTKYFMDATPNGRIAGFGSPAEGMEWNDNRPDYWISTFDVDGGSTWAARAKACGYETSNPCPSGWRLPSKEEFAAIAPEGEGIDYEGSLGTKLSGYAEAREYKGVRYAIRWIYNKDYLQIECVVDDNVKTDDDITDLFWDQHVDDRVVRIFPYTGSITPLIMLGDGAMHNYYELVVRPFHRGIPGRDIGLLTIQGFYGERYFMIDPEDTGKANNAFGGYWTEDKNSAFRFQAGEKMNSKTSYLQMEYSEGMAAPVLGYAIRPVMAK